MTTPKTPRPIGTPGKSFSFGQVLAEGQRRQAEYEASLAGLSPEDRAAKIKGDREAMLATVSKCAAAGGGSFMAVVPGSLHRPGTK